METKNANKTEVLLEENGGEARRFVIVTHGLVTLKQCVILYANSSEENLVSML